MAIKKILLGSVLLLGYYGYRRYISTTAAFNNLKAKIDRIHGIDINFDRINLLIDLKLSNLSNYNLSVTTFKLVSIKQFQFFNRENGSFIGKADVDVSGIEISAKSETILKDIKAVIPVSGILKNISLFSGSVEANLNIVIVFDVAGKEYILNTEKFN